MFTIFASCVYFSDFIPVLGLTFFFLPLAGYFLQLFKVLLSTDFFHNALDPLFEYRTVWSNMFFLQPLLGSIL